MSVKKIIKMKGKRKIVMVTAYDYPSARIAEDAGVDIILVGDSLANTVLGCKDTLCVSMEDMLRHTQAVKKGALNTFVVGDMPFLSYQTSEADAIKNAGLFLKAGADAVKLEGGIQVTKLIEKMVAYGIPVMGHIGFTPQSYKQIGIRKTGKGKEAEFLIESAKALEEAGAFAIVLEMVKEEVAKEITQTISIPTIGIGSGKYCDGQVLVWHDILGLNPDFTPSFAKKYINGYEILKKAIEDYKREVIEGSFPE